MEERRPGTHGLQVGASDIFLVDPDANVPIWLWRGVGTPLALQKLPGRNRKGAHTVYARSRQVSRTIARQNSHIHPLFSFLRHTLLMPPCLSPSWRAASDVLAYVSILLLHRLALDPESADQGRAYFGALLCLFSFVSRPLDVLWGRYPQVPRFD